MIGILGLGGTTHIPAVLKAVNPLYAVRFFIDSGWHGFFALGAVFLLATGGEAMYADIGHFGRKSVNVAQFFVVLPGSALNYFGQCALLLESPESSHHLFYLLAPKWATTPQVFASGYPIGLSAATEDHTLIQSCDRSDPCSLQKLGDAFRNCGARSRLPFVESSRCGLWSGGYCHHGDNHHPYLLCSA